MPLMTHNDGLGTKLESQKSSPKLPLMTHNALEMKRCKVQSNLDEL